MANTPKGFPYPLGTDRVMDGDDAIHSLATFTDTRVGLHQCGNLPITPSAANTTTTVAVTFPVAFPAASVPNVVLGVHATTIAPGAASWWTTNITNTGFQANVQRSSTTTLPVQWLAMANNP